jgi:hypothetical protein
VLESTEVTKKANGESGGRSWPKLGVSARPETKELLHKLAAILGVPEWRAVEIALLAYVEALPPKERKAVSSGSPISPDLVRCEYPAATAAAVRAFLRLWMEPKDDFEEAARTVLADQLGVPVPE